jgi:hypothetical protein
MSDKLREKSQMRLIAVALIMAGFITVPLCEPAQTCFQACIKAGGTVKACGEGCSTVDCIWL